MNKFSLWMDLVMFFFYYVDKCVKTKTTHVFSLAGQLQLMLSTKLKISKLFVNRELLFRVWINKFNVSLNF